MAFASPRLPFGSPDTGLPGELRAQPWAGEAHTNCHRAPSRRRRGEEQRADGLAGLAMKTNLLVGAVRFGRDPHLSAAAFDFQVVPTRKQRAAYRGHAP